MEIEENNKVAKKCRECLKRRFKKIPEIKVSSSTITVLSLIQSIRNHHLCHQYFYFVFSPLLLLNKKNLPENYRFCHEMCVRIDENVFWKNYFSNHRWAKRKVSLQNKTIKRHPHNVPYVNEGKSKTFGNKFSCGL